MATFIDFKQKLIDLVGQRARICFYLPEMGAQSRGYEYLGRILEIDTVTKCMKLQIDPQDDEFIKFTYLNLDAVVIYAIDEIDEEADLSDKPDQQDYVGEYVEFIPFDRDGRPTRDPKKGYVILDHGHICTGGAVYTKLRETEEEK